MSLAIDPAERQRQVMASMPIQPIRPRRDYEGVTSYYELPYARPAGLRPLSLDLHVPDGTGPFPTLLWAHGGGWRAGVRGMGRAHEMAQRGYAVAAVDYRLSGESTFPAQLHDLQAAVRWLRTKANTYHLDPQRIVAWGASAGAHLALLLGLTGGFPEMEGEVSDVSSGVQAVIDFFGPTEIVDLRSPAGERSGGGAWAGLLGYEPSERPDAAEMAMPVSYARSGVPPVLIVHGDIDPMVSPDQSQRLYNALNAAGADVTLVMLPGAVHEDPSFWEPQAQQTILEFLRRVLGQ